MNEEPNNPDKYYTYRGKHEINGVVGYAIIKKWFDEDGKPCEKVESFDPYIKEK